MINLSVGQTVGFIFEGNIYRGELLNVVDDSKEIQITHINGNPPELRLLNKKITWDGPILGLVQ